MQPSIYILCVLYRLRKLTSISFIKSNWIWLLVLGSVFRIAYHHLTKITIDDPDASSAIRRARTDSCRKELEHFAKIIALNEYKQAPVQHLRRTCDLDSKRQRNIKVGCASNSTKQLIKLDEQVSNTTVCLELCFSYGHSHGGFDFAMQNCYCSNRGYDKLRSNEQVNSICHGQDEFDWHRVNNGIYYPSNASYQEETLLNTTIQIPQVRIAFLLILNGRSLLQIQRLFRNIYSKTHIYYIHVDKRNEYLFRELLYLEQKYDNVLLARSRFYTIWGSPSLLRMILDAIGHLSQYKWDYLINLSESDFPLKPISQLENYLGASARKWIYLKNHNMKGYKFIKKQGLDKNFYQCEDRVWRMGSRKLPRGLIYSGGSDWIALPKDFCTYILDNLSNSKAIVKPLINLFNYTLLPAESFFHTLASNSEFCDRVLDNNLRITNWRRKQSCKCQHNDVVDWCGCSPLVYRSSDSVKLQKAILSKDLFFTRKFDPTISSSAISFVEEQLVEKSNATFEHFEYDTRFWQNVYTSNNYSKLSDRDMVLQQVGLFSLQQILNTPLPEKILELDPKLKSVSAYFKDDRFVGLVYHYCIRLTCIQFLVEKNHDAHVLNPQTSCFDNRRYRLKAIEVNHGFDTGERMFRDFHPLGSNSAIVVYHEWFVEPINKTIHKISQNNSTDTLQFVWMDPLHRMQLVQDIKLKEALRPMQLTLAHRFNTPKPYQSGQWTLAISQGKMSCLDYKFLIFNHQSFIAQLISQRQFNMHFHVSKTCSILKGQENDDQQREEEDDDDDDLCYRSDWSLLSKSKNLN